MEEVVEEQKQMEEEQTEELELKIQVPMKTIRKLKAFLLLSGKTVAELEAEVASVFGSHLSAAFDSVLSTNIMAAVAYMDGIEPSMTGGLIQQPLPKPHPTGQSVTAHHAAIPVSDTEHTLSGDDAEDETLSVEEQVENDQPSNKMEDEDDGQVAGIVSNQNGEFPNAGGNADAFLDAAMATSKPAKSGGNSSKKRGTRAAFDSRSPRVRVLATSENEEENGDNGIDGFSS